MPIRKADGMRVRRAPPVFVDCVAEVVVVIVEIPDPVVLVVTPNPDDVEPEDPVLEPGEAVELVVNTAAPKLILTIFAVSFKPF